MIPPNIKEEIEKKAQEYTKAYEDEWFTIRDCYLKAATQFYIRDCYLKAATQFYQRGLADRDAIAKAAFEAAQKSWRLRVIEYPGKVDVVTAISADDYLASDEYKKLVGDR